LENFQTLPGIAQVRAWLQVHCEPFYMKMLFYSSDGLEVELVSKRFLEAGIPCEIRRGPFPATNGSHTSETELWIRNDRDCHRAFMLCVALGLGFARRKEKAMAV
jgi:hypothetical protein